MKMMGISTLSLSAAPRTSVLRVQEQLRDAQKEVVTGRFADIGLTLGARASATISLSAQSTSTDRQIETNSIVAQRFDVMQIALTSIGTTAQAFLGTLIANGGVASAGQTSADAAKAGLDQLTAALNSSAGARYLFSGASTDRPGIGFTSAGAGGGNASSYGDASTAKAATAAAFVAAFGFAQDDPAASTITAAEMDAFLSGGFDSLFSDAAWSADWSGIDGAPVLNRISDSEEVNVSYGADNPAFRNIAKAYVMLADLGAAGLGEGARRLITEKAAAALGEGIAQLNQMRTGIGASQSRVETATETLRSRSHVLSITVAAMEEVDPYEASTRVTSLMNQLEASYALTARISRLSLLNFL